MDTKLNRRRFVTNSVGLVAAGSLGANSSQGARQEQKSEAQDKQGSHHKAWKSLGPDDFVPVIDPGQGWVNKKLLNHGACFPPGGRRDYGAKIEMISCLQPASGSALHYGLSGNDHSRQAAEAGLAFWKKYRDAPDGRNPCPELGPEGTIQNERSGISLARRTNALFLMAEILEKPELLDWVRDHLRWWLDVIGYDEKNHAFPNHVNLKGEDLHGGSYVYNVQAGMAVTLCRIGERYGIEEYKQIGEDMLRERIFPMQFEDGYWNYNDKRDEPKTQETPKKSRLENYQLLTLKNLTYLLNYPSWANDPALKQAIVRGCKYAQSQIDPMGCVPSIPNFQSLWEGRKMHPRPYGQSLAWVSVSLTRACLAYDKPEFIKDASRVVNWWFHNRPVLYPFFDCGNRFLGLQHQVTGDTGYGLSARYALVLAWEGWHLRRKNAWTVELTRQA